MVSGDEKREGVARAMMEPSVHRDPRIINIDDLRPLFGPSKALSPSSQGHCASLRACGDLPASFVLLSTRQQCSSLLLLLLPLIAMVDVNAGGGDGGGGDTIAHATPIAAFFVSGRSPMKCFR
ncbi:hypothetical protein KPH14_004668 [Odynerus spinipes]|uniref:Uncharacterized protein n=1 Tax=Odynerus spinipes TaxID=1348599 RepID=A0AAD9VPI7_9HYME|nr:hypothetical protein KPH14_004668 [Odynerus spinipes]